MVTTTRFRPTGWVVMTILATLVALASTRYFSLDPRVFIPGQAATYLAHLGPLMLHIAGGVVALALGPWQFLPRLRSRRPVLHRLMGRAYLGAVVAVGVGGLLLAPLSIGGPLAHLGFGALALALLFTSGVAYVSIRRRRLEAHRAWMTRSYALIFGAVTFRVWLGVGALAGLPFETNYAVGSWTTGLINLLIAELLIHRSILTRPAHQPATSRV